MFAVPLRRSFVAGLLCLLACCWQVRAQEASVADAPVFVENRGQWEDAVRFKSEFRGGALFFERDAVLFSMEDREQVEAIMARKFAGTPLEPYNPMVDMYAYRVRFVAASPESFPTGRGRHTAYHNYYLGNDPTRWATGVPLFDTLCYPQLYEGIDLIYYINKSSYKYEFRVAPYARPEQIGMLYEGADRIRLKSGNLVVQISSFESVELKPYAYQEDGQGGRWEVECRFERKGNKVSFRLGEYEPSFPLVIDPVMVFCSYTGSRADNWGYTATYDRHGNMYGGGSVFGSGYPVTTGAYQRNYGGGSCDIGITKFSRNGDTILFSTYLGGRNSEVPHSLVVNENDELYVLASTSSPDYPVTFSSYNPRFTLSVPRDTFILTNVIYYVGGIDIAISKLSADGTQLMGSTFFGGSGPDGLSTDASMRTNYADEVRGEITVDAYSNVYVVSSTASRDLPVSSSAFQRTYGGGRQDGCVAKFSYDLRHLIWCSYLGGDSSDAAYSLELDKECNVYVCGGTRSRNLPVTPNVMQGSYGGGVTDGYIARIATNGNRILSLTYFGKTGYDQTYLVKTDQSGFVYVMGLSDAPGLSWVYNARWFQSGGSQILSKLDPDLSKMVWSTAFGTGRSTPDLSPSALMVDLCHQVYFSGWGSASVNANIGNNFGGTRGLSISSDAIQLTTDNNDFYFMSLNDDASQLRFASYFGGRRSSEHVDGGTSRFDRKGCIYQAICAACGGNNDLPVTSGVAGPRNNSRNCNLGVVKIDFNIQSVVADFSVPNVICAPKTIVCENNSRVVSANTTRFDWDFGDGTSSTAKQPSHTYTRSGTYTIRLIVCDRNSCNGCDTMEREIVVLSSRSDTLPDKYLCKGDFVQIGLQPANTSNVSYTWTPSVGLSSTTIANPIASDTVSRTYYLFLSDGVCTDTFRIRVHVLDARLEAGPDIRLCIGDTLRLHPVCSGGDSYIWSMTPSFFFPINPDVSQGDLELPFWQPGTYYIRLSNAACVLTDSLRVFSSHVLAELPERRTVCLGDTLCVKADLSLSNVNDTPYTYIWQPLSCVVGDASSAYVCLRPEASLSLTVAVRNIYGCVGYDTMSVIVDTLKYALQVQDVRCNGQRDGEIRIRMLTGTPPYRYTWSPNVSSSAQASALPPGAYRIEMEDASGCRVVVDTQIREPAALRTVVVDTQCVTGCNGDCDGYAELLVQGGTPPYRYQWNTGETTLKIRNLCAGEYLFYVEDANQCRDTMRIEVRDTSHMSVRSRVTDASCHGSCDGGISLVVEGVPPFQYQWVQGYVSDTVGRLCAGTYDVTVMDARQCSRRLILTVQEPPALVFDSLYVRPTCYGKTDGSVYARAGGGTPPYRYFWNGQESQFPLAGLAPGSYPLRVTDSHGCTLDTALSMPESDSLSGSIAYSRVPCAEACVAKAAARISGGTPPYRYQWDNGDTGRVATALCYGTHSLVVTDANGCSFSLQFFVDDSNTFPQPVQAWADRYLIYAGETVTLSATDLGEGFRYYWRPSDGLYQTRLPQVTAEPKDSITYVVEVRDQDGCLRSDTVRIRVITVICDYPYVFVPNTFSPNGDGLNDVLYVRGEWVERLHFAIYDRWGEKVFETENPEEGWDGTYRGKPCEQGVYVYYAEIWCRGRIQNMLKGNVTLVR
ncbi:MAG: gliding motility-associated C-terminal domain-containing protein [Bacteroidales bacterium]|nr:gliding motility-associated C-terminal domain-containing protein [Bacteroidales bacterium]